MNSTLHTPSRAAKTLTSALLLLCAIADAQEAPEKAIKLSPFLVNGTADAGYTAANTLSAGRFNASLRDTAQSVSVFTSEFLEDVGIQDMDELLKYTVNTVMDNSEFASGSGSEAALNNRNAQNTVEAIRIRGITATKGRNFYQAITPDDSYNVERYDESRGPNSILFGLSSAGGMISSSTAQANAQKNKRRLKYTFGSDNQSRSEVLLNQVLIKDKLGLTLAGLHQENAAWRDFDFDDRDRLYAAVTWTPTKKLTIRAMGEAGKDVRANVKPFGPGDQVQAWIDWGKVLGARKLGEPGINPISAANIPIYAAYGVGNRVSTTIPATDPRYTYIVNDGTIFNAGNTLTTESYNNARTLVPFDARGNFLPLGQSSPAVGAGGNAWKSDTTRLYPLSLNLMGPDNKRWSKFSWYELAAEYQLTKNLYLTLGFNDQKINLRTRTLNGMYPTLRGDPNRLQGVGGPANPYAGKIYVDSATNSVNGAERYSRSKEMRASMAYELNLDRSGFGRHFIAAAASNRYQADGIEDCTLAFLGMPFSSVNPSALANQLFLRTYVTEGDYSTYAWRNPLLGMGDRFTTNKVKVNGVEREIGWVSNTGRPNTYSTAEYDSYVLVSQSKFFKDRVALTLGYRKDYATNTDYGYKELNKWGYIVNRDRNFVATAPGLGSVTSEDYSAQSKTAGLMIHVLPQLSLVANVSSGSGLPDFNFGVLPDGDIGPPSKGEGRDYGIAFNLIDNKINGRLVYYETFDKNVVSGLVTGNNLTSPSMWIMDAFAAALVGPGKPYTAEQWGPIYSRWTVPGGVSGDLLDTNSRGFELSLTANVTKNWRLMLNASKTDKVVTNIDSLTIPWLGFQRGKDGLVVSGITSSGGTYTLTDPSAYLPDGAISKWLSLLAQTRQDVNTFYVPGNNQVIGAVLTDYMLTRTNGINDLIEQVGKRWGLRPYTANLYTSYTFDSGRLKGFSVGGGVRWQSANIIGAGADGSEIAGRSLYANDLMVRYRQRLKDKTISYQVNVSNVLDDHEPIPQRLGNGLENYIPFPGPDRGYALQRIDLVAPRSFRASVTLEF
jgi:iron complex outermembrane receptor protein